MQVRLKLDGNMRVIGTNSEEQETIFDANSNIGGDNTAASPMEVFLQSMTACTFMDVISILRKKRKEVTDMVIDIEAQRAEEHPRVFTEVMMHFTLTSPDAELQDLNRSIELSKTKYCSASAMFQRAGCKVNWTSTILRPS